jgi:cell division protein FtsA
VLCGGGTHVTGIVALGEKIFQMNVNVGQTGGVSGLAKSLDEPEFATAIGLVKYGTLRQRKPMVQLSGWSSLKELVKRLYSYIAARDGLCKHRVDGASRMLLMPQSWYKKRPSL